MYGKHGTNIGRKQEIENGTRNFHHQLLQKNQDKSLLIRRNSFEEKNIIYMCT